MRPTRIVMAALALAAAGCGGATTEPAATREADAPAIVARIGGREITMDAIDVRARETDIKPYQALYDARKQALESMVTEYLLDAEASERGITREALIEQEVNAKIVSPSVDEIRVFYEENEAAMRGRSLEEMSAQIRNHLAAESRQRASRDLLTSLKDKHAVEVSLEPPRVTVTVAANDPTKGPAGAPVQILEFSDFQ